MVLSFDHFFSLPVAFFRIVGLDPTAREGSSFAMFLKFVFWFAVLDLGLCVLFQFAFLLDALVQWQQSHFLPMISATACCAFGAMGWQELVVIFMQRDRVLHQLAFLRRVFPASEALQLEFGVEGWYRKSRTFMGSFAVTFVTLISAFNFFPVVMSVSRYLKEGKWSYALPFYMWFPFDPSSTRTRYVTMYVLESLGGFAAVLSCLAANLFFVAFVEQVVLQFRILRTGFARLNLRQRDQLRSFVVQHCRLMECVEEMNRIFSASVFVTYICSSLLICCVAFLVLFQDDVFEIIKFCLFLISALLQTLTISYFGQEVIDHVNIGHLDDRMQ